MALARLRSPSIDDGRARKFLILLSVAPGTPATLDFLLQAWVDNARRNIELYSLLAAREREFRSAG
jgi:hypothetical protein